MTNRKPLGGQDDGVMPELHDLPTSIQPENDLWPGTRRRIEVQSQAATGYSRWAIAAGVLAALAGTVWWSSNTATTGDETEVAGANPALVTTSVADSAQLARYEDRVLPVRKELARAAARQQTTLTPHDHAAIVASVEALDEAIGQIRLALADRPEDPTLNRLLAATYRREADLAKRLQRI